MKGTIIALIIVFVFLSGTGIAIYLDKRSQPNSYELNVCQNEKCELYKCDWYYIYGNTYRLYKKSSFINNQMIIEITISNGYVVYATPCYK